MHQVAGHAGGLGATIWGTCLSEIHASQATTARMQPMMPIGMPRRWSTAADPGNVTSRSTTRAKRALAARSATPSTKKHNADMTMAISDAAHRRVMRKFCMPLIISTPSPRSAPYHSPRIAPSTAAGAAIFRASAMAGRAQGSCRRRKRSHRDAPKVENTSWALGDVER